jgi:hypothetical protein
MLAGASTFQRNSISLKKKQAFVAMDTPNAASLWRMDRPAGRDMEGAKNAATCYVFCYTA